MTDSEHQLFRCTSRFQEGQKRKILRINQPVRSDLAGTLGWIVISFR
ncbi:hypothetical protein HMPREF1554_02303 [Porphyromonas gingivalis F0569]|nr:hypothetical protein HMPREF1554_02303 [Porphyromonas gingivalis F0569]